MNGTIFIALYRGVNVGGNNPVKMKALCAMHEALGHVGARNYLQSGNVAFRAEGEATAIAKALDQAFAETFGFTGKAMVFTAAEWDAIVAGNPFAGQAAKDPKTVHAALCEGAPDEEKLATLLEKVGGPEEFTVKGSVLYLLAPAGVGRSKFVAGMERAAGVPVTARNWRTVEALQKLATELAKAKGG